MKKEILSTYDTDYDGRLDLEEVYQSHFGMKFTAGCIYPLNLNLCVFSRLSDEPCVAASRHEFTTCLPGNTGIIRCDVVAIVLGSTFTQ